MTRVIELDGMRSNANGRSVRVYRAIGIPNGAMTHTSFYVERDLSVVPHVYRIYWFPIDPTPPRGRALLSEYLHVDGNVIWGEGMTWKRAAVRAADIIREYVDTPRQ